MKTVFPFKSFPGITRQIYALLFVSMLLGLATGCGGGGSAGTPGTIVTQTPIPNPTPTPALGAATRVRAIHAAPGTGSMEILVDDEVVVPGIGYGSGTHYISLASGNRRVRVRQVGSGAIVYDKYLFIPANDTITVAAIGAPGTVEVQIAEDLVNTPPAAGMVKVNLFYADYVDGPVDVYITDPGEDINVLVPAFTNVAYKSPPKVFTTDPGPIRVRLTRAGSKAVILDSGTFSLVAGESRTMVAIGDGGLGISPTQILVTDN